MVLVSMENYFETDFIVESSQNAGENAGKIINLIEIRKREEREN